VEGKLLMFPLKIIGFEDGKDKGIMHPRTGHEGPEGE